MRPDARSTHEHRHPHLNVPTERRGRPAPAGRPALRRDQVLRTRHGRRGIDLESSQGEIVAFLGPNGAGKTTTIDMVLGLSRPTTGTVDRARAAAAAGHRPRPGLGGDADRRAAQGPHRPRDRAPTPRACSPTPGRSTRCSPTPASPASPTARSPSAPAASSSGCGSRWRCSPTRRCCCSTSRPPAWTSRVAAPSGRRSARDARRGRTVLFATHYLEEADQYADRIVLISHGRIVADGTGAEIKALAVRPHRARHAPRRRHRRHRRPAAASTPSRCAATPVLRAREGQRRRRPPPAHRRPTPATSRSPPAGSRTPS